MDLSNAVRLCDQYLRRPELVFQVEAASLELGGQPSVQEDDSLGR